MSSSEEMKTKFLTPPAIEGEPTYTTIHKLVCKLYTNAASVKSTLGVHIHGHLGLIMTDALYSTISLVPYVTPHDPGLTPNYPRRNITLTQRTTIEDAHKVQRVAFNLLPYLPTSDHTVQMTLMGIVGRMALRWLTSTQVLH